MKLITLFLIICLLMTTGIFDDTRGENAMEQPYLLITGNAPEPPQDPQYEAFIKPDGKFDAEGYLSALTAAETIRTSLPTQTADDMAAQRSFLRATLPQLLSGSGNENVLYSPLNLYLSLGLLAELTGSKTQEQVLTLLHADTDQLSRRLNAMWYAVHSIHGDHKSGMASSIWLNDQLRYNTGLLQTLAERYYTSSYQGEMGSPGLDLALQHWLNEQTGHLLEAQSSGIHLDSRTCLALATAITYRVPWATSFNQYNTAPDVFHAANGEDLTTDFMHRSQDSTLFAGQHFSAVSIALQDGGEMRFILPDEGYTPQDLLTDSQLIDFLCLQSGDNWPEQKRLHINIAVPRFDVSCDLKLEEQLQQMGLTDVFSSVKADFTPLLPEAQAVSLSRILHAARVKADEEGIAAAAYTVMTIALGAMLPLEEETDFILNRPFLFELLGADGSFLFAGIVNRP